ncbi:spore germination protein [Neobacillus cucumis]|uniref:spore germination protein n=1 Tax=Neobacillus cucumis TaxID=1740721 RepID=UPI002E236161|nr:spore germination protein [Neobacillus cucumis]
MDLIRNLRKKKCKKIDLLEPKQQKADPEKLVEGDILSRNLSINVKCLKSVYTDCPDVIFRDFLLGEITAAVVIYLEGLANIEEIDHSVLQPLMRPGDLEQAVTPDMLKQKLTVSKVNPLNTLAEIIEQVSIGNPVILIDGQIQAVSVGLAKWEKRAVEEPIAESVVRGPRDGFTETLGVNISLLRRKLKSPDLKWKKTTLGKYSQTQIVYMYMKGIADDTLVEEVHNRLNRIDIDGILESGYIEEFLEDDPYSPFPQMISTERPDSAAAHLLEGRVVILTDGTPFALIGPVTFYSLLQSPEDYYQRFMIGTLIRWLRYSFLLIALLLPSSYVAILTFHQEMIPTTLLLSVAESREKVPFPALIEALLMEITFEALREAGIRLPKQVGSAVSIVGALVIGDAAVSAGLVSAPMVMVVAITGIASFAIPRYNASIAIRVLRFPMIFFAGTLGLLGIMLGILLIIVHLCTLRSFGVPYLSPMAPLEGAEVKDVLLRAPWWSIRKRPHLTGNYNKYRQSKGQKPSPADGND